MKQADGPKLAGTSKTVEQLMKQIREGKSPMPGFKNQLKDEEVQALAEYIKALPTNCRCKKRRRLSHFFMTRLSPLMD